MGDIAFVVRSLPGNTLKGAFRVHINPDALAQLKLKVGDVCNIIGEDGTRGTAIAWRAADKMGSSPKSQPLKMSEILRDTFGFKQGTQVRVERVEDTVVHAAKKVMLIDITPSDYDGPADDRWKVRCISTLGGCEAFAAGTTFDVSAGEGFKKRYYIEHIETNASSDAVNLTYFADTTELHLLDGPLRSSVSSSTLRPLQIDSRHIGGLHEQIEELNHRLRMLCSKARTANVAPTHTWNRGILIHGFRGTGKTLLLNELAKASGLRKVIRIGRSQLLGTPTKNESAIQTAFNEAHANQPSMVVIDDLDRIASSNDATTDTTADHLAVAFDSAINTQILIVCSAKSPIAVHEALLDPGRLTALIELPIPDIKARIDIIASQLPEGHRMHDSVITQVGSMTHGFTGKDLARLIEEVADRVCLRMYQDFEDWVDVQPPPAATRPSTAESLDSREGSVAATLIERPATPVLTFNLGDFEAALQQIRPSALRELIIEPPKVTFEDIGGSTSLQSRFDRIIKWPLERPEQFAALPQRRPRRGVLLYGPPGCSKTMTAQAVASSYGWNFIAVKGAELISMYVGESERALREIFRKAKQASPTIIFFDEIDSIASARSGSADNSSKSLNVVTTLLNEMDGFEATKNVLVLAATNKPEALDPAILRPGRFDEHIYLGPPDAVARLEILKMCVLAAPGGLEINLEPIVTQTEGMSGAEIKNAWNIAGDLAVERSIVGDGLKIIAQDIITGVVKTQRGITQEMLQGYEDFATGRLSS